MYLNKVMLYGNLTSDPELKSLPTGNKVISFSIATNRSYKDQNGAKKEIAEYHNIVAFGKVAETIAQWFKKGKPIFVEGRLQTRSWDDINGGGKRYKTEVVLENFQFGPSSLKTNDTNNDKSQGETNVAEDLETIDYGDEDINPDDIPF